MAFVENGRTSRWSSRALSVSVSTSTRAALNNLVLPQTDLHVVDVSNSALGDLNPDQVAGVVWEWTGAGGRSEMLPAKLREWAMSFPVLLWIDLDISGIRRVLELSAVAIDLRISSEGAGDGLEAAIRPLANGQLSTTAEHAIIKGLLPSARSVGTDIIVCAATLGKRRRRVGDLARAIRRTERTLEWRFRSVGAPSPASLLGWVVSLHCLWQLEFLAWPMKRVAQEAGFSGASALSNHLHQHLGVRARVALSAGGFWYWLNRLAARIPR